MNLPFFFSYKFQLFHLIQLKESPPTQFGQFIACNSLNSWLSVTALGRLQLGFNLHANRFPWPQHKFNWFHSQNRATFPLAVLKIPPSFIHSFAFIYFCVFVETSYSCMWQNQNQDYSLPILGMNFHQEFFVSVIHFPSP